MSVDRRQLRGHTMLLPKDQAEFAKLQALRTFDQTLRKALTHHSSRQIGHLAGVDHSTINRLYHGNRRPMLATALAIIDAIFILDRRRR